ncbi:hypothetical protein M413DRAFT_143765 [Hebeloma cylindrosporum]|uniref:Uncharacterized protein n=1 Tax=Hebeloma cylindrosporum TaxID=76867 RepID=A0A0C3CEK2_HEBCY|nr:hypothetical protein M413DRAFT_143765 [Hebeloma cylindrosporum h7]
MKSEPHPTRSPRLDRLSFPSIFANHGALTAIGPISMLEVFLPENHVVLRPLFSTLFEIYAFLMSFFFSSFSHPFSRNVASTLTVYYVQSILLTRCGQ